MEPVHDQNIFDVEKTLQEDFIPVDEVPPIDPKAETRCGTSVSRRLILPIVS